MTMTELLSLLVIIHLLPSTVVGHLLPATTTTHAVPALQIRATDVALPVPVQSLLLHLRMILITAATAILLAAMAFRTHLCDLLLVLETTHHLVAMMLATEDLERPVFLCF